MCCLTLEANKESSVGNMCIKCIPYVENCCLAHETNEESETPLVLVTCALNASCVENCCLAHEAN